MLGKSLVVYKKALLIVSSGAAIVASAAILAYAAAVRRETRSPRSKSTPAALTVLSSTSLPPEVQALEPDSPALFDARHRHPACGYAVSRWRSVRERATGQRHQGLRRRAVSAHRQASPPAWYAPIAGPGDLTSPTADRWTPSPPPPVTTASCRSSSPRHRPALPPGFANWKCGRPPPPVNVQSGRALLEGLLSTPAAAGPALHAYNPTAIRPWA